MQWSLWFSPFGVSEASDSTRPSSTSSSAASANFSCNSFRSWDSLSSTEGRCCLTWAFWSLLQTSSWSPCSLSYLETLSPASAPSEITRILLTKLRSFLNYSSWFPWRAWLTCFLWCSRASWRTFLLWISRAFVTTQCGKSSAMPSNWLTWSLFASLCTFQRFSCWL